MNNNISLIISGTVSGFAQLFCLDVDNKYQSAKVDFDFRNRISGIGRGQVAYAVSFTRGYFAYSRIYPILDAYRRDGILVVSVLLGPGTGLASSSASSSGAAIEELLRSIQDRFLQLHFRQSALDTNFSALMQNDYMDILSRYHAIPVEHRQVQPNIPEDSVAYVITDEFTVPRYFDNITRRSFQPFSTVFFVESSQAPQSARIIPEPPEEKKVYAVRLKSRELELDQLLGTVSSLDEKVMIYSSEAGYEIIREQLSYNDITSNIDSRLRAVIHGEEIDIEYIPRVKRTVFQLVFADRENRPFDPSSLSFQLNADGVICPSGSWTIENDSVCVSGKLANKQLTLSVLNVEYHLISSPLASLIPNKIVVLRCFSGMLLFPQAGMPKTVTLRNIRFSSDEVVQRDVKDQMPYRLYGEPEDWELAVSSEHYEPFPTSPLSFIDKGMVSLTPKAREETIIVLEGIKDKDRATLSINGKNYSLHYPDFSHNEVLSKPKNTLVVSCSGYKRKSVLCDSSKRKVVIHMEPNFYTVFLRYAKIVIPALLLLMLIIFGITKGPEIIKRMTHKPPTNIHYDFVLGPCPEIQQIDSLSLSATISGKDTTLVSIKEFKRDKNNDIVSASFDVPAKDGNPLSYMLAYENSVMLSQRKEWSLIVEIVKQEEDETRRTIGPSGLDLDNCMSFIKDVEEREKEFYDYSKRISSFYNTYIIKDDSLTTEIIIDIKKAIDEGKKYKDKNSRPYSSELINQIESLNKRIKVLQKDNSSYLKILLDPNTTFADISELNVYSLSRDEKLIRSELMTLANCIKNGNEAKDGENTILEDKYKSKDLVIKLEEARALVNNNKGVAMKSEVRLSTSIQKYYDNIKDVIEKQN